MYVVISPLHRVNILLEDIMYDSELPMPNRELFRQSIVYQGAVAWNGLANAAK